MRPMKFVAAILVIAGLVALFAVDDVRVSSACTAVGILLSLIDDFRSGRLRRD
jgi:hypothetical protein